MSAGVELAFAVLGIAWTVVTVMVLLIGLIVEWRHGRHVRPVVEPDVMTVYPGGRTATVSRLHDRGSRA